MSSINRGAAVFTAQTIGVSRETTNAFRITACATERINGVQKEFFIEAIIKRQEQLMLIENPGGFKLEDVINVAKGADTAVSHAFDESAGQRRIDVARAQEMARACTEIGNRDGGFQG